MRFNRLQPRGLEKGRLPRLRALAAGALVALTWSCARAEDASNDLGSSEDEIVGGVVIGPNVYPAVGIVAELDRARTGMISLCTGTLIGSDRVLTAAHCVQAHSENFERNLPRPRPASFFKFIVRNTNAAPHWAESLDAVPLDALDGFQYDVAEIITPTDIDWAELVDDPYFGTSDVAVLRLTRPVLEATPMPVATNGELDSTALGKQVTLVGYGTALEYQSTLTKRRTRQSISSIGSRYLFLGGAIALRSTCDGDSGGPVLLKIGAQDTVIGVTSGGSNTCLSDQNYARTDVLRDLVTFTPGFTSGCSALPQDQCLGENILVRCQDDAVSRYACADEGGACQATPSGASCVALEDSTAQRISINGFERGPAALELNNRLGRQTAKNVDAQIVPRPDGKGHALQLTRTGIQPVYTIGLVAERLCANPTDPYSVIRMWVKPLSNRASISVRLLGRIQAPNEDECYSDEGTVRTSVLTRWITAPGASLSFDVADFDPPAKFVPMAIELIDMHSPGNRPILVDDIVLRRP